MHSTVPANFASKLQALGLTLTDSQVELLRRYVELLQHTNRDFNLISIRDPDQVWERHILDSLAMIPVLLEMAPRTLIDVGSGGGLPGIPIAVALPRLRVTLVESISKKANFLSRCARDLSLPNVEVVAGRAENLGRLRMGFDIVTARAVAPLKKLLPLCVPLLGPEGTIIAMKGEQADIELAAAASVIDELRLSPPRVIFAHAGRLLLFKLKPPLHETENAGRLM